MCADLYIHVCTYIYSSLLLSTRICFQCTSLFLSQSTKGQKLRCRPHIQHLTRVCGNEFTACWKPVGVGVFHMEHAHCLCGQIFNRWRKGWRKGWGGTHLIFIISHEQHCGRQTHHDSVDPQRGAAILSRECFILIRSRLCLDCIQHLSKQNTCPHDSPFFGGAHISPGTKMEFLHGQSRGCHTI